MHTRIALASLCLSVLFVTGGCSLPQPVPQGRVVEINRKACNPELGAEVAAFLRDHQAGWTPYGPITRENYILVKSETGRPFSIGYRDSYLVRDTGNNFSKKTVSQSEIARLDLLARKAALAPIYTPPASPPPAAPATPTPPSTAPDPTRAPQTPEAPVAPAAPRDPDVPVIPDTPKIPDVPARAPEVPPVPSPPKPSTPAPRPESPEVPPVPDPPAPPAPPAPDPPAPPVPDPPTPPVPPAPVPDPPAPPVPPVPPAPSDGGLVIPPAPSP